MTASTFVSGAWQVSAIHSVSMQENKSALVMQVILPFLSRSAASQVRRVLAGEADGMIAYYLNCVPVK